MKKRLLRIFGFLLIVAMVAGIAGRAAAEAPVRTGLPCVEPAQAGMDAACLAKIPERMREFVEAKQIAGSVTLVARRVLQELGVRAIRPLTAGRRDTRGRSRVG